MKFSSLWIVVLLLLWGDARSMEPDLTLQQLNHKGWTVDDGAPGAIYAITQTTDGTLWVGGPSGLSRFDGIHFVRYDEGDGRAAVATKSITALAASADGGLWIGYSLGGISVLRNSDIRHYGAQEGLSSGSVYRIVTDRNGVTYAATTRGVFQLQGEEWQRIFVVPGKSDARVSAARLDRAGSLWVLTSGHLWARPAGQTDFRELAGRNNPRRIGANGIAAAPDGKFWVLSLNRPGSLARIDALTEAGGERLLEVPVEDNAVNSGMEFDRDGNLWLGGTSVRRLPAAALAGDLSEVPQRLESFARADGLTGGSVNCFFEDREGNMWAGTYAGLDKFSHSNVVRVNSTDMFGAAVAGKDGVVWVSGVETESEERYPMMEIRNGSILSKSPSRHFTTAYRSPDGSLWFGGRNGIERYEAGRYTATPLPVREAVQAMVEDKSGAMWVSINSKGLFRFAAGRWASQGNLVALPREAALVATADATQRLWFGYRNNQIARVDGSEVRRFGQADGLAVGNVTAIAARQRYVWVAGDRGLARFDGKRFAAITPASGNPFTGISGIVALDSGDVWLNGNAGIVHLSARELDHSARDATYRVQFELFDRLDGLRGYARQLRPSPSAFEGTDGRIWFATQLGLVAITPARIQRNPLPPPVTIWTLQGMNVQYPAVTAPHLPIHTTNVRIAYTAASLTVPERVRFRYKLDGLDKEWQDVGDRREALYTNLGPGRYSFHVIASNNDGVWNTKGASLSFSIAPAFYQTKWFYGLCALLCLGFLRLLYIARIRQVSAQVRARLEERLTERERIARELHDTLLQSVQGLVLRFRAAVARLPRQEPARLSLEQALERADGVITEGRDRVKDLRSAPSGDLDLPQEITGLGEELAAEHSAHFRATVEGPPRSLHPIVREETMSIAREALINAFRHAAASQIEVEITYGESELRIRIRDNGRGIDMEVLSDGGRAGHWGLLGMRERARKIRGQLTLWSKADAGTEVDLRLPAHIAYQGRRQLTLRESLALRLS